MANATYKVEKYSDLHKQYQAAKETKVDVATADRLVLFLTDCINVDGFYRHTITYPDGRVAVKHSSYNDVQGIVNAIHREHLKQS
jgi:hypothetical protein